MGPWLYYCSESVYVGWVIHLLFSNAAGVFMIVLPKYLWLCCQSNHVYLLWIGTKVNNSCYATGNIIMVIHSSCSVFNAYNFIGLHLSLLSANVCTVKPYLWDFSNLILQYTVCICYVLVGTLLKSSRILFCYWSRNYTSKTAGTN